MTSSHNMNGQDHFAVDTEKLMEHLFHNEKVNNLVHKLLKNIPEKELVEQLKIIMKWNYIIGI